ncbi:MAG: (d)CMP kinase [Promethearchaeota archaeon]|jgi:cytidylate kinase
MILTISGLHGTGKSTIGKNLSKRLGIRYYSTGEAFRELAKEMGLTMEEFNKYAESSPSIDKKLDKKILGIAQKGDVIIDSQLSAYILESIADFKILLVCSLKTRVERMAERDNTTFDEKLKETRIREKSELERFKKLYNIDLSDKKKQKKLYNLILDIEKLTIEEVESKILSSLKL